VIATVQTSDGAARRCSLPSCGAPLPDRAHVRQRYCVGGACRRVAIDARRPGYGPYGDNRGHVAVSGELYEQLRRWCSRNGRSMRLVVEAVIDSALEVRT